jgi:acetyltransferase-like isoleucine patch superfamily enzyme
MSSTEDRPAAPAFDVSNLESLRQSIMQSEPSLLETAVRSVLIHYFYHVSNKRIVEVVPDYPGGPASLQVITPTEFRGQGRIRLAGSVMLGVAQSPGAYASSYLEARSGQSLIEIGKRTIINNRASILSDGAGVHIGERCLIGQEFLVTDSNFHELAVERRGIADQNPQAVRIGNDVFIGARVTILKGCRIGDGAVIGAGSMLPPGFDVPPMAIVSGNPARVVGTVAR